WRFESIPIREGGNKQPGRQVATDGKVWGSNHPGTRANGLVEPSAVVAHEATLYVHAPTLPILFEAPAVEQRARRASEHEAVVISQRFRFIQLALAHPVLR